MPKKLRTRERQELARISSASSRDHAITEALPLALVALSPEPTHARTLCKGPVHPVEFLLVVMVDLTDGGKSACQLSPKDICSQTAYKLDHRVTYTILNILLGTPVLQHAQGTAKHLRLTDAMLARSDTSLDAILSTEEAQAPTDQCMQSSKSTMTLTLTDMTREVLSVLHRSYAMATDPEGTSTADILLSLAVGHTVSAKRESLCGEQQRRKRLSEILAVCTKIGLVLERGKIKGTCSTRTVRHYALNPNWSPASMAEAINEWRTNILSETLWRQIQPTLLTPPCEDSADRGILTGKTPPLPMLSLPVLASELSEVEAVIDTTAWFQ